MLLTHNSFKHFLIEEIRRKSNISIQFAIREVDDFSLTPKFESSYQKWRVLQTKRLKNKPGVRHVMDVFKDDFRFYG